MNPNERRTVICKICKKEKPHHAKEMCYACYRKNGWKRKKVICRNCGRETYHKAFGLCATCHIKLHHYDKTKEFNYRKWHDITLQLYKEKTRKCLICDFDKVVELYHLDGNHKNNSENNLIGLCPNHHRMVHNMKYVDEIREEIRKRCLK